jgi:lipoprotein LprG
LRSPLLADILAAETAAVHRICRREENMRKRLAVTSLALAALLAACGSLLATPTPIPTATPTPTPTPKELLEQAADATLAAKSLAFTLLREGEPVLFDPNTGIKFSEASGEYQAPDRVYAKIKAQFGGTLLELEMFWLPEGVITSNPLTGGYTALSVSPPFNAVAALGKDGFPGVLKSLDNVTREGTEQIEDVETLHLRGEIDQSRLVDPTGAMSVLMPEAGTYVVDVWMDITTSYIVRLTLTEPGGSKWLMDLSEYDAPVEIEAPEGVLP